MKFHLQTLSPEKMNPKTCLIIGIDEEGHLTASGKTLDQNLRGQIKNLFKQGIITGKCGTSFPLFSTEKGMNLLLIGCGKKNVVTKSVYSHIVTTAAKAVLGLNINTVASFLSEIEVNDQSDISWQIQQMVILTQQAAYRFDRYKTTKEPAYSLKECIIHLPAILNKKTGELALKQGLAIAEGMTLTKDLANQPSNVCTPTYLANQAKALAKAYPSLSLKILGEKEMKKLGMGAILGVSQGSAEEAHLICLEYKGSRKKQAPVALVGKGITFDTGGNSLKPADSMVGMKYDMCGAATVLGVLKAAAELKLKQSIIGIIPAVENMPGGTAYKPEDILTSLSGQTIEVISTDAEGRLILADALTYAERYQPDVVIDIATLTGAVVIALGSHATGLMSNDETLSNDLLAAGIESHDRAWPLPLWEEYQEQIKSPFADMANTGGRSAGSITAGCFLARFAKKFRWAHLDVAGTAAVMSGTSERKATGRPVPLLMQYLIHRDTLAS